MALFSRTALPQNEAVMNFNWFRKNPFSKANPSEALLRSVMAAFWLAGWFFVGAADATDWHAVVLFILHAVFGLLWIQGVRDGTDISRVKAIIRVQTLIILFGLLIQPESFNILSPVVAMLAAMRLSRPQWITWALVLGAMNLASEMNLNGYPLGFSDGLVEVAIILAFATFSYSITRAQVAKLETQTVLADLREAHQRLQEYTDQVEDLAVAEERNRISRDLHDTLGHRLTVSIVQLEGAGRLVSDQPDKAVEMIETVRQQLDEGLREVRRTVSMLRAPSGADLSLPVALKQLADDFEQATQLAISVFVPDSLPTLPETHRLALYRATQEALTNIQRHAEATTASVRLTLFSTSLELRVQDDGRGMPVDTVSEGFGLRGMKERIEHLGGSVDVESTPD